MPIAIQEDMLPGRSIVEKCEAARALGIAGIEFWSRGLTSRVPQIVDALDQHGLRASSVNFGRQGRILDEHPIEREQALNDLRRAICDAVDLNAAGVTIVPRYYATSLPDLSPWMSATQLEAELLHMHLRTLSDFCEALGTQMFIQPVNRYETTFINRVEQAAAVCTRINHPRVKIAPNLFHMMIEEADAADALRTHAEHIGMIYVADSNRRLPGLGGANFALMAEALRALGPDRWLILEAGDPGANADRAADYRAALPTSMQFLNNAGLI